MLVPTRLVLHQSSGNTHRGQRARKGERGQGKDREGEKVRESARTDVMEFGALLGREDGRELEKRLSQHLTRILMPYKS